MASDLIFYQFSRSKVERGDFRHFLDLYAPDKLPTGRRLREMMNGFVFCIEGWPTTFSTGSSASDNPSASKPPARN
jgi:hypothetical protein